MMDNIQVSSLTSEEQNQLQKSLRSHQKGLIAVLIGLAVPAAIITFAAYHFANNSTTYTSAGIFFLIGLFCYESYRERLILLRADISNQLANEVQGKILSVSKRGGGVTRIILANETFYLQPYQKLTVPIDTSVQIRYAPSSKYVLSIKPCADNR